MGWGEGVGKTSGAKLQVLKDECELLGCCST